MRLKLTVTFYSDKTIDELSGLVIVCWTEPFDLVVDKHYVHTKTVVLQIVLVLTRHHLCTRLENNASWCVHAIINYTFLGVVGLIL